MKGLKRRILSVFLAGIVSCSMLTVPVLAGEEGNNSENESADSAQTEPGVSEENPTGEEQVSTEMGDLSDQDAADPTEDTDEKVTDGSEEESQEVEIVTDDTEVTGDKEKTDSTEDEKTVVGGLVTTIDGGQENPPLELILAALGERISLASTDQVTSDIDFVQYALDIAYDNSIGYGHGWAEYGQSTISCSGLVGVSLTACGYGDFTSGYENGWGYQGLSDGFVANLRSAGFTQHYSYGSVSLKAGDILLYITGAGYQHTGIYVGNGLIVEAMGDFNGDGDNGRDVSGDEVSCHENHDVWTDIYRSNSLKKTDGTRFSTPCETGASHQVSCSKLTCKLTSKGVRIRLSGLNIKNSSTGESKTPSAVNIACWTEEGGQDDLVWVTAEWQSDGSYMGYYNGYKHWGTLNIHAYTEHDSCKNLFVRSRTYTIPKPAVKAIDVQKLDNYHYRYTVTFDQIAHTSAILCPTWYTTEESNQNDLQWLSAEKESGTTCTFTINTKKFHKYSGTFTTHIYVKAGKIGLTWVYQKHKILTSGTVCCQNGKHIIAYDSLVAKRLTKKVKIRLTGLSVLDANNNLSKTTSAVRFACWTEKNGQDDLQWVVAEKQSDGSYVGYYTARKHKGTINIHVYADHSACRNVYIGSKKI